MTSFSPSSVPSRRWRGAPCAALLAACLLTGCGDDDGSAAYRDGRAAFAAGDFARAEACFADCLRRAPAHVDALLMQTRTALRLGEVARAAEAVTRAETLAGDDSDVIELVGQVAFQGNDFVAARKAFARLAGNAAFEASVRSRGHAGLGVVDYACIKNETLDETAARARTAFLTAIRLDARNAAAHYHLGRLYADVFHYLEIAQLELTHFVYLAPKDDPRTIRVRDKLLPGLQSAITAALQRHPGAGRRNPSACTVALAKGDAAFAKGQKKKAKLHYGEAHAADVLSYPAAIGLAKCADTAKEALTYYKLASEIRPSSAVTLTALGDAALKVGSPAVAEEAYSRALAASPKDATALARLVSTLRKNGKGRVADVYRRYGAELSPGKR
ncbi:MAG: tetratricopeptide repeat protein [Kiritimatiellia bacterium]